MPFRCVAFFTDRLRVECSNKMIPEFGAKGRQGKLLSGIRNRLPEAKDQPTSPLRILRLKLH